MDNNVVFEENLKIKKQNDSLNDEITRKREIIAQLLTLIASTYNKELISKSLDIFGRVK